MTVYSPLKVWHNAYTVDFTSLPAQNLKTGGNGTKVIDGKSWTWANDANALTANLVPGTGILVQGTTTSFSANPAVRAGPLLTIPILSLFPAYSVFRSVVRVQTRMLTNAVANTEGVRVGIEDATSPLNQAISIFKGVNGGVLELIVQESVTAVGTSPLTDTTNTGDDLWAIIFEAPLAYEIDSGVYSSALTPVGLPGSLPRVRMSQFQDMANPLLIRSTQPSVVLSMQTGNTAGTATATWTHLQIDYLANNLNL